MFLPDPVSVRPSFRSLRSAFAAYGRVSHRPSDFCPSVPRLRLQSVTLELPLLLDGAVQGLVYGLLAMTVVLIYRSSKVINFAIGAMGLIGSGVLVMMT